MRIEELRMKGHHMRIEELRTKKHCVRSQELHKIAMVHSRDQLMLRVSKVVQLAFLVEHVRSQFRQRDMIDVEEGHKRLMGVHSSMKEGHSLKKFRLNVLRNCHDLHLLSSLVESKFP